MELSISTIINICLGMLCLAVMVQCVRLDRALKGINSKMMATNVSALDTATERARLVLTELKRTLSTDGIACAKAVTEAKAASDELNLMVKIGGSMADRLVEAAEAAPKAAEKPAAKRKAAPKSKTTATKAKTSTSRKKAPAKKSAAKKTPTKKAATKKAATRKPAAARKKASPNRVDATAQDIKVAPAPGTRTLRLVPKDGAADNQAEAA